MDLGNLVNLTNLKRVGIGEVEELAKKGDLEFCFSEGELTVDYSEFLSGDKYDFWTHLILFLPNFPLETDPKDLFIRFN